MIRTIIVTIYILLSQNLMALAEKDNEAVSMVFYEQTWLDYKGTIALKNNTSEIIHNVSFLLEYQDIDGKPMDYETFSYNIEIAPGMTKKLDIPAYEHNRHYEYYKTKKSYSDNPEFKIRYELKDYNSVETNNYNSQESHVFYERGIRSITLLVIILMVLGVYVGMYILVVVMAQRRNRNPVVWLLLSFIATPILMCIILGVVGELRNYEY